MSDLPIGSVWELDASGGLYTILALETREHVVKALVLEAPRWSSVRVGSIQLWSRSAFASAGHTARRIG